VGAGAAAPNPALFQALLSGGGLGGGLSGSLGPFGAPPAAAPADSRPPEERFQLQFQVRPMFAYHHSARLTVHSFTSNYKIWISPT
jgi:ubiquilin